MTRMRCHCIRRVAAPMACGTAAARTPSARPSINPRRVDYGILLAGERVLVLDNGELVMKPGDVVVQLGNWHGWTNPRSGSLMALRDDGSEV